MIFESYQALSKFIKVDPRNLSQHAPESFFTYISISIVYIHQHSSSAAALRYLGQQHTKCSPDLSFYTKNTTKHENDDLNTFILYNSVTVFCQKQIQEA